MVARAPKLNWSESLVRRRAYSKHVWNHRPARAATDAHDVRSGRRCIVSSMDAFAKMGRALSQRWRARHHEREAFPELALEALREGRSHEAVTPTALLRWVFQHDTLPPQADLPGRFGQPPITLFYDDMFSISALFWLDGTTSIHQHAFSGAFAVLDGSSVHARYDFERREQTSDAVVRGELRPRGVELLTKGDAHAIYAGPRFIHALFHLDRPSVSLVIRTHDDGHAGPQYDYSRAGLGVDPHFSPPTLTKTLQCLTMLLKTSSPESPALVRELMSRADAHAAFRVLSLIDVHAEPELFTDAVAVLDKRDASLASALSDAVLREREAREIASLRADIADPELRYFLALLLNAPLTRPTSCSSPRRASVTATSTPASIAGSPPSPPPSANRARRARKKGRSARAKAPSSSLLSPRADLWALGQFIRGESERSDRSVRASRGEAPNGASMRASESAKLRFILAFTSLLRPFLSD